MLRHGDWWITVVGDVPAATLRLFAERARTQPLNLVERGDAADRRCAAIVGCDLSADDSA